MVFEKKDDRSVRRPDFVAREGISVWTGQTKTGEPFLNISIPLLNIRCCAFKTKEESVGIEGGK